MFGLFNTNSRWKCGIQVVNLAALSLATYDLITNPEASLAEVGFDVLVHAASFLSLKNNADTLGAFITSGLNMARFGAIYAGVTSGCTGVPLLLNGVDAVNHLVTSGAVLCEDESQTAPKVA